MDFLPRRTPAQRRSAGSTRRRPGEPAQRRGAASRRAGSTAPGRQRRSSGPGPTRATAGAQARLIRRPPAGLTGRAVLLGIVVCALVLSLAYPIKEYLGQRSEIAALEQTRRETQDRVEALQFRQEQLQDPAYVEQQARQRLHYAMPGDRVFVVVDDQAGSTQAPADVPADAAPPADGDSWLERLGESVRRADAG